jgi:hypothetical protein
LLIWHNCQIGNLAENLHSKKNHCHGRSTGLPEGARHGAYLSQFLDPPALLLAGGRGFALLP